MDVPKHYDGKEDVIAYIENRDDKEEAIRFCLYNILKYATRMKRKGQLESDLEKIVVYSNRALDIIGDEFTEQLRKNYERNNEHITRTVDYLSGQFGNSFVLDYIQGSIIESSHAFKVIGRDELNLYMISINCNLIIKLVELYRYYS